MHHTNDQSNTAPADGSYDTVAAPAAAELRVQRSRFLASVAPAATPEAVAAHVAAVARRYHDCRHVCHAWRLGWGPSLREGRHDAGEPSGTAGEPILSVLRGAGVSDTVLVVARYFGGIKLGTGGLGRAYRDAAARALAAAPRRRVVPGALLELRLAYGDLGAARRLLAEAGGAVRDETYGEREVHWRAWLPRAAAEPFLARLVEATAGRAGGRLLPEEPPA